MNHAIDVRERAAPPNYMVARSRWFDEKSPTVVGPVRTVGYCTGDSEEGLERLEWIDFCAPVYSGCHVTVALDTNHSGIVLVGKILEFTRDGAPWLVCYGDRKLSKLVAIPLEHPGLRVLAIGATVLEVRMPSLRAGPRLLEDEQIWRHLEPIGRPALQEWRRCGFPPRAQLPVINHLRNIEFIRSALCRA
jgi:hypothetical protein